MDVGTPEQVDLTLEDERLAALHIGTAWKELRRGAAMSILRDHMFGAGKDALEPGQVDTLDLLVQQPAWRMSDLADALRVDPSTATRAVQRLERSGLAERCPVGRRRPRRDGLGHRRSASGATTPSTSRRRVLDGHDPRAFSAEERQRDGRSS